MQNKYYNSSMNELIANLSIKKDKHLIILKNSKDKVFIENAISLFHPDKSKLFFHSKDVLPFENLNPSPVITFKRLSTLNRLIKEQPDFVILDLSSLFEQLPLQSQLQKFTFALTKNQKIEPKALIADLIAKNYTKAQSLSFEGEFCQRGAIIDIFPWGQKKAFRIEFFDDFVESIYELDEKLLYTKNSIEEVSIMPSNEFILSEDSWHLFVQNYEKHTGINIAKSRFANALAKQKSTVSGLHIFSSYFQNTQTSILDYVPKYKVILCQDFNDKLLAYEQFINDRYKLESGIFNDLPKVHNTFWQSNQIFAALNSRLKISFNSKHINDFKIKAIYPNFFPGFLNTNTKQFISKLNQLTKPVVFLVPSSTRANVVAEYLSYTTVNFIKKLDLKSLQHKFNILVCNQACGYISEDFVILSEFEIFGSRATITENLPAKKIFKPADELVVNDLAVHEDYGICKYLGIKTIKVDNQSQDVLELLFAKEHKIFLPIHNMGLVSKYIGEASSALLSQLGSKSWHNQKTKIKKHIKDVAANLLAIEAKRIKNKNTNTIKIDESLYTKFLMEFPFADTPDQQKVTAEILADLKSDKIMDRVLCGDVGFGKTEIAMRATFCMVASGFQVAIVCPTTVLVNQHLNSFKERFKKFDYSISALSGFNTTAEKNKIKEDLASGKLNIIIGTHSLFNKNLSFNKIGLLIIDEEHRFGVAQKEQIKQRSAFVNILSMTATPIPRTLNLAMHNIRDLSLLTTPPKSRLAIDTKVISFDLDIFKLAISRELQRGGQIFFVHNNIQTIKKIAEKLATIVDQDTKIAIAHGSLPKDELENIMFRLYSKQIDILVCTTIIETGIDVKTANTIIINDAHKLGIAQLYQIRGRIGRSNVQGFAYLVAPDDIKLNAKALQRVDAIKNSNELGVGFSLASKDLDIRGAGSILGEQQSGNINKLGLNMYLDYLDIELKSLKNNNQSTPVVSDIEVNTYISTIITEEYIPDVNQRLEFYRMINAASDLESLLKVKALMMNLSGKAPIETINLLNINKIKLFLRGTGVKKIQLFSDKIILSLDKTHKVNAEALINAMNKFNVKIAPDKITLNFKELWFEETINFIELIF